MSANKILNLEDYLSVFPFPDIRPKQHQALQEICNAFSSGYRVIVLDTRGYKED